MELKLIEKNQKSANIKISPEVFDDTFNESLVHQAVVAFQARARQGSSAQKSRAEVKGGGAKPWAQKGSGRARAGTKSSPIWRSGGVTFAAKPRSYGQKLNKKMYRKAMRSIFSMLVRDDRLHAINTIELKDHKTKTFIKQLSDWNVDQNVLIITDEVSENLYLASRNIPNLIVIDVHQINPVVLLRYKRILMTVNAIKHLEESLS